MMANWICGKATACEECLKSKLQTALNESKTQTLQLK